MRRIWLPSTGASPCTGLSAFLPLKSVKPKVCLVKSLCRALQNLQEPWAGGPVHVLSRSMGLTAQEPHSVQSHLTLPCSTICLT
eukprot:15989753-Heterocapsa_arctica.AAC.1